MNENSRDINNNNNIQNIDDSIDNKNDDNINDNLKIYLNDNLKIYLNDNNQIDYFSKGSFPCFLFYFYHERKRIYTLFYF